MPDEADAVVLPDARPTYQAVAADIDGDGDREIARLVAGPGGSIMAEAWFDGDDGDSAASRWR